MVGCMIQVFHGNLGANFVSNTHKDNVMEVALSPGDGLLLERVAYDQYNRMPTTQEPVMLKLVSQEEEVQKFREYVVSYIAKRELKDNAFTCWLCWLDDNREEFYI